MTVPPRPGESHPPLDGGHDEPTVRRPPTTARDELTVVVTPDRPRPNYDPVWPDTFRPDAQGDDRFTSALTVDPQTPPSKSWSVQSIVVAAAAGVACVCLLSWLLWPSGDSGAATHVDAEAQKRLAALLPSGYPAHACTPAPAPKGAVAVMNCTNNADAGGPPSATYLLVKDDAALRSALTAALAKDDVVDCPGNIQSPGPWRRIANPQEVAGTLVCGMPQGRPQVVWTKDAELMLNVVRAGPEGPTLTQLYEWWSNHS